MRTFLGGSMAMASLCGMEICTGLAESCFEESLLMERRNYESGQLFRRALRPRSVALLWLRRTFTMIAPAAAMEAVRGGRWQSNKQRAIWVEPRRRDCLALQTGVRGGYDLLVGGRSQAASERAQEERRVARAPSQMSDGGDASQVMS